MTCQSAGGALRQSAGATNGSTVSESTARRVRMAPQPIASGRRTEGPRYAAWVDMSGGPANRFIVPLSVLELGRVREGGTRRDALDEARRLAGHVEALGFRRIWV